MGKHAGRSGHRYRLLRAQALATCPTCWHCGQPIDRSLPDRDEYGNANPNAWTLAHKKPLSLYPHLAEDPANLAGAHRRCNLAAGNREQHDAPLGATTIQW